MRNGRDQAAWPRRDRPEYDADAVMHVHPMDYLRILYRRRRLVAATIVVGVAAAVAYNASVTPRYDAQATLLIESDKPNVVSFQEVVNEGLAQDSYYQTQLQLLASRTLARQTAAAVTSAPRSRLGGSETAATDVVQDGLRIVPVRGTRMVNVRFRSTDPVLAAEVANTHAREYIEQSLERQFRASKEATEWLDAQLAEERTRVARSESALQAYREQHDAVSLTAGQDIVVQKLADLNGAVTRAKTTRIEKEARYRELFAKQGNRAALDAFPEILANPFIQQLKADLARLQREYSQLAETLGDRHPTLLAKRTEMQTTDARLAAEVARVVDSVRNEFQAARAEEASLVRALEVQKDEALALNRRGIEYAALEREAQSVRQVYQTLLQRAKETSVSGDLRATNIRIIDPARVPTTPMLPRTRYNLLLGLLGGVLVALGLVFGWEVMDDRARTPDDIRRRLQLPVIGLVPEVECGGTGNDGDALLLQQHVPPSVLEAVRAMRTGVLAAVQGKAARTIVVASAYQGEGKSVVASSLAIALARAHQRVLLIDGDLRRPGVHRLFGSDPAPGLSGALGGDVRLANILLPTRVPGLTVMPAGHPSEHAPELLGSARFNELLQVLQEHFPWIIVDSPPVLSVTDATILARRATGVLLVVASGRTSARAANLAAAEIRAAGGTILGAVLTRVDLDHHPFYFSPYSTKGEYRPHPVTPAPEPSSPSLLDRSA